MKKYLNELWHKFKNLRGLKAVLGYLSIIIYIFIITISLVKINYTCLTPGMVAPVSSLITVNNTEAVKPMYIVSVYEYRRVSILHYWLGLLNPEVEISAYDPKVELNDQDDKYQGELMKKVSITNSVIMAYTEAQKNNPEIIIDYTFNGLVVVMINRLTDPDLHLGDIITAIDGVNVTSYKQFENIALAKLADKTITEVSFTVKRDDLVKEIMVSINIKESDEQRIAYFSFMAYEDYTINEVSPTYSTIDSDSYGPSGGLMQALAIYDAITAGDLTKGKKIIGTGTISVDGEVGAIGGIKQKIITASLYNADYFFVPRSNYEDALAQYNLLKNPKLAPPIVVDSFADAINFLSGLEA